MAYRALDIGPPNGSLDRKRIALGFGYRTVSSNSAGRIRIQEFLAAPDGVLNRQRFALFEFTNTPDFSANIPVPMTTTGRDDLFTTTARRSQVTTTAGKR